MQAGFCKMNSMKTAHLYEIPVLKPQFNSLKTQYGNKYCFLGLFFEEHFNMGYAVFKVLITTGFKAEGFIEFL